MVFLRGILFLYKLVAVLSIVTLAITLFLLNLTSVQARPPGPGEFELRVTYHSDATRTNRVGGWCYDCYDGRDDWVVRTSYSEYPRLSCDF